MKTKNLIAAVLLILTVGFASCEDKNKDVVCFSETELVSWSIVPNVVSENSEEKNKIENRTQRLLTFYAPFSVQYFDGKNWVCAETRPVNIHWVGDRFDIASGKTLENDAYLYNWLNFISNSVEKGKYRIVRQFHLQSGVEFNPETDITFNLYAEFIVE